MNGKERQTIEKTADGRERGITLIESVIYIGILAVTSVFLINSVIALINVYKRVQIRSEVFNNASAALSAVTEEIRSARAVYSPTSVLDQNQGQLSLRTLRGLPPAEIQTYVDFYLDNKRIYLKREGAAAFPVTSEKILVSQLRFSQIGTGTTTPSVKISLTVSPNLDPANKAFYFTENFTTTAGLR